MTVTGNISCADPGADGDVATKRYVDNVAQGLDTKASCRVATTTSLNCAYDNGTNGAGATLTSITNNALSIDGVTSFTTGDRVLVKDQTAKNRNGIYEVTNAGEDGLTGSNFILTRATPENQPAELTPGSFTFIEEGTNNANNGFVFTHTGTVEFGTTELTVEQFSGAGSIIPGTGLTKTGNELSLTNTTVSFGGISLALGGEDNTPAFDLTNATNYPTSSLSGTITNTQLENSSITINGSSATLGDTNFFATKNIVYTLPSNLETEIITNTLTVSDVNNYEISITPKKANSPIKVSFNIAFVTSWQADQNIDLYIYKNSAISSLPEANILGLGNGNAAGPLMSKIDLTYIDTDNKNAGTQITYKLKAKTNTNPINVSIRSRIVGSNNVVGFDYKSDNLITAEELY